MMVRLCLMSAVLALAAGSALAKPAPAKAAAPKGDAVAGKTYFDQQCALCHSAKAGQEGAAPSLFKVYGRKAASDAGFPAYSKALKASNLSWTSANLDKWLAGPTTLVPGANMPINVGAAADRKNLVAYLATVK